MLRLREILTVSGIGGGSDGSDDVGDGAAVSAVDVLVEADVKLDNEEETVTCVHLSDTPAKYVHAPVLK